MNGSNTSDAMRKEEPWENEKVQFIRDYWQLTSKERQEFDDLKQRVSDIDHWKNTPDVLVRFLRARPDDVPAAEEMFRTSIQWRIDNSVDTILEEYDPPRHLKEYFPGAILRGDDKEGDPIFVGRLGSTDAKEFLKRYGEDEMLKHAMWIRELVSRGDWISSYEQRQGRPVKRITIIEDLQGLSIFPSRDILSLYGKIMKLDQDNYCETAKKLIVIRAPLIFRAIWALVRNFFDPGVKKKIVFLSSSDYQTKLDKYIDRKVLPSCISPDGGQGDVVEGMFNNLQGGKLPIE